MKRLLGSIAPLIRGIVPVAIGSTSEAWCEKIYLPSLSLYIRNGGTGLIYISASSSLQWTLWRSSNNQEKFATIDEQKVEFQ